MWIVGPVLRYSTDQYLLTYQITICLFFEIFFFETNTSTMASLYIALRIAPQHKQLSLLLALNYDDAHDHDGLGHF